MLDLDLGGTERQREAERGGEKQREAGRPLSVLHYPGQAKPWKYVHLFSSEGLLAITQSYKSDSSVAVERRLLLYNIDTADPAAARHAPLSLSLSLSLSL